MAISSKYGAAALCCAIFLGAVSLPAQVTTLERNNTEKRPEPRDPRYLPPSLPDYLREKLNNAPGAAISPTGEINAETILRAQGGNQVTVKKRSRHESRDYSDSANTRQDRLLFSDSVLRQFGIDSLPSRSPRGDYKETEGRRFQVVYFLSLPYTLGISYAAFAAGTNQLGGRVVFNGPQTASFIAVGLGLSGLVAWHDNRRWLKVQAENKARERRVIKKNSRLHKSLSNEKLDTRAFSLSISPNTSPSRATSRERDISVFRLNIRFRY